MTETNEIEAQETEASKEVSLRQRFLRPQTLISFVVAFVVLWLLYRQIGVDMQEAMGTLRHTNLLYLLLAFVSYYLTFPLRGWRWRILLDNAGFEDLPPLKDMTVYSFLGYFANAIVPAKLGDVYRSYLLKKNTGFSFPAVVGTVFSEWLIALIVLALLVAATSFIGFGGQLPADITRTVGLALVLVVVGVVGLLALRGGRDLIRRIIPERFRSVYIRFEEGIFLSLKRFPLLVAISVFVWLLEGGRFFFAARALDLPVDPMTSLFIALGSALLTVLPLTPSGLGLVESGIVGVLLLASELQLIPSIGESQAFSVALLDRLVAYWSLLLIGALVHLFSKKTK